MQASVKGPLTGPTPTTLELPSAYLFIKLIVSVVVMIKTNDSWIKREWPDRQVLLTWSFYSGEQGRNSFFDTQMLLNAADARSKALPSVMNTPIRLLVFDLDGTLIDSKRDIILCVKRSLAQEGLASLASLDDDVIGDQIGRGSEHLFRQLLGGAAPHSEIEPLVKHFRNFYSRHLLDHTSVYPGIHETLTCFRALPKVVVTNKSQEFADILTERLGLKAYFEAVFGAEAFSTQKPDGGPLRAVCERWDIDPSQSAIVGDSVYDIQAGKRAAVKTVAALYGFTKPDELRSHFPDFEIESALDLAKVFTA